MKKKQKILTVKENIPKLINYFLLLVFVIVFMLILIPIFRPIEENFVLMGINFYDVLTILAPITALYIIFKISRLIFPMADELADQFAKTMPGLKTTDKVSLNRVLSNFAYIIIIILVMGTFTPLVSKTVDFAGTLFYTFGLLLIILLFYDSVRTIYLLFGDAVTTIKKRVNNNSKKK